MRCHTDYIIFIQDDAIAAEYDALFVTHYDDIMEEEIMQNMFQFDEFD